MVSYGLATGSDGVADCAQGVFDVMFEVGEQPRARRLARQAPQRARSLDSTTRRAVPSAVGVMLNSRTPSPIKQRQHRRLRGQFAAHRDRHAMARRQARQQAQQPQQRRDARR